MQGVARVEELPDWAQNTVRFLLAQNYLQRNAQGKIPCEERFLRVLVTLDAAGIFE